MMNESIQESLRVVEDMLMNERPKSVLEISGFDGRCGELILDCQKRMFPGKRSAYGCRVDRVDLSDAGLKGADGIYNRIYSTDYLIDTGKMRKYDVIIIFHLFENLADTDAKSMLEDLLRKAKKQVLVLTPEYPYDLSTENEISGVRSYHPVFFLGLDFSHKMLDTPDGALQVYSFFPKIEYEQLKCDMLPETVPETRKLKIAYILAHHNLTGAMKALFQQMKELTGSGHQITAYYRSDTGKKAIPDWSHLTDDDISGQFVIPENADFLDHINGEDIIVICWMQQIKEFMHSNIPVVLWDQGSSFMYGDYGDLLHSESMERLYMHRVYRMPVHLLSVSETVKTVLKGVYGRESQLFPNGIDTEFYYPLENKSNDAPVVLLVGPPSLKFKGFDFALRVLEAAHQVGIAFKVRWVSQEDFTLTGISFSVEKYIKPPQEKLAELFRTADVFLSASLYESFPLPPLEAMASGTAVIATDCGGIRTYAEAGKNCLLCDQGDLESVFFALQHLLLNSEARKQLAAAGRETAMKYSFTNIAPRLEQCLNRITALYELN